MDTIVSSKRLHRGAIRFSSVYNNDDKSCGLREGLTGLYTWVLTVAIGFHTGLLLYQLFVVTGPFIQFSANIF